MAKNTASYDSVTVCVRVDVGEREHVWLPVSYRAQFLSVYPNFQCIHRLMSLESFLSAANKSQSVFCAPLIHVL